MALMQARNCEVSELEQCVLEMCEVICGDAWNDILLIVLAQGRDEFESYSKLHGVLIFNIFS